MKRLLKIHLSLLLMFSQVASATGTEMAQAPAPAASVSTPTAEDKKEACETNLDKNAVVKYKPIGYVTGALVNRFSNTTPFLFTETYFRALGAAMYKNGYSKVVNAKGVFLDNVNPIEKERAINILGGKADDNIELQGRIATAIWNRMVDDFQLKEVIDTTNSVAAAKKAYYTSTDDYMATRDFLLQNIGYKREVIELIRLSIPFGIRMAVDGVSRSEGKSIFLTALATGIIGTVAFAAATILKMIGTPDPGIMPMLVGVGAAAASGFGTYLYTAPKTHFRKLHLRIMNWANRRALAKRGLISKEDGESTLFIKAAFKEIGELQQEVDVAKIRGVIPILPSSADEKIVEASMNAYGAQLKQMLNSITTFQEFVSTEMDKQARQMGAPIATLGRLLQMKGDDLAHGVPEGARIAIGEYEKNVTDAKLKIMEIEGEFEALVAQYEMHEQILSAWADQSGGRMNTTAKLHVENKLSELRNGIVTVKTLHNVATTQKKSLDDEQKALASALLTIAAAQGNKSLNATQVGALTQTIWALTNRVDAAHANEIADNEQIPTGATEQSESGGGSR